MRTGTAATRETVSQAWSPVLTAAGVEGQELGRQILALAHQVAVNSLPAPLTACTSTARSESARRTPAFAAAATPSPHSTSPKRKAYPLPPSGASPRVCAPHPARRFAVLSAYASEGQKGQKRFFSCETHRGIGSSYCCVV